MSTFTTELHRNAEGFEVWRILRDGATYVDDIASDHDLRAILDEATDLDELADDRLRLEEERSAYLEQFGLVLTDAEDC